MFGEKDKIKPVVQLVQPDGTITAASKHRPSAIQVCQLSILNIKQNYKKLPSIVNVFYSLSFAWQFESHNLMNIWKSCTGCRLDASEN